jgi:transposase
MTTEQERIAQLEAELATLQAYVRELLAENAALKRRLAQDSHNSSKPPASDGLARRPRSMRRPSGKKPGGQPSHLGHTLALVATPDLVQPHVPAICEHCQQPLAGVPGVAVERRQVQDLPPLRLEVIEHQVVAVTCPACQAVTRGIFPDAVRAPAQYGPRVRALAVYLHHSQVVPQERTHEALADVFGCTLSDGSVARWVEQAGETLAPIVARLGDLVAAGPHQHADETGIRITGKLHWLHVNSTRWLTHLAWHPKRGTAATAAIGIWPRFHGRATHDRWASYDAYADCTHSWCGAHLLRELTLVAEQDEPQNGQGWAGALADLLRGMCAAANEWRSRGATSLPAEERSAWIAQYHDLLAQGFAAQPPPRVVSGRARRRRGRPKPSPAKNLLDALLQHSDRVLAFLDDLTTPFTNNQAERDLRMAKVQQKVAGTFRSETGATAYCRLRSYLSTMRKQGHGMLDALSAVFAGRPLPVAWGC